MPSGSRWGPRRSLLALSPILIGAPWLAYNQHFRELSRFLEKRGFFLIGKTSELPEPLSAL